METKNEKKLIPAFAVHPGEILREELKERGIKQKDFSKQIGVQATHLNEVIKGKRNINADLAQKLERNLGISFQTWMNLQNNYIYDCKAIEERDDEEQKAITYEQKCAEIINITYIYKYLGIKSPTSRKRVEELKKIFSFDLLTINELCQNVTRGLYKHSEKVLIDKKNMLAWVALNMLEISRSELPSNYQNGNAVKAANEIAKMANEMTISVGKIRECLNSYGILYLNVGKLEKVPIDAYSTIYNDCPVVTVTYRYNDMDKLVFDILHELCHIDRHFNDEQKGFIAIDGIDYSNDPKEKEANEFAKKMLIPDEIWKKILNTQSNNLLPHKVVQTIAKRAKEYNISPSIAISRYKHEANWYKTSLYKSPKIS